MPFPNTRTIPRGWSQHHVKAAAGAMNATCVIEEQTGSVYDKATDTTTPTWTAHYAGACRVQVLNQAEQADQVGQAFSGQGYLLQLDFDAAKLTPGLRVRITSAPNDQHLLGVALWLVYFEMGSERFTRDITVSDDQADVPKVAQ